MERPAVSPDPLPSLEIPLGRPLQPLAEGAYDRHRRSLLVEGYGERGQQRLAAARVLVVGAGGLGSPVLFYLAAMGVGTIYVSDADTVELNNLQRPFIHTEATVGVLKSESAASALRDLNSEIEIVPMGPATTESLDALRDDIDLVMECSDVFATKYLVGDWCATNGKPLVWASVMAMIWQASIFWTAPPAPWRPLALRDLHAEPPAPGAVQTSHEIGVLGPVVGQVASTQVVEAVKLIVGTGSPLFGRVLVGDARTQLVDQLEYAAAREAAA